MTRHWTPLALTYLALAAVGLIGTWTYNVLAILGGRDFIGDLLSQGPAVSSISTDLLVVACAGSVFVFAEARRLRMRFAWLYVAGAALTAFAFTFPLFLAHRQRRLTQLDRERASAAQDS